jgi:hypothetical protein
LKICGSTRIPRTVYAFPLMLPRAVAHLHNPIPILNKIMVRSVTKGRRGGEINFAGKKHRRQQRLKQKEWLMKAQRAS